MQHPVIWSASSVQDRAERRTLALNDDLALGLAAGLGPSKNPKTWICEDSVALLPLKARASLLAVADAHFGGQSSEAYLEALPAAWADSLAPDPVARLRATLAALDARYHSPRPPDPSETTLLLVHVRKHTLSWVNVGDSLLFLVRGGDVLHVPTLSGHYPLPFLGRYPMHQLPDTVQPDGGQLPLVPGDVVVLATDGIEADVAGLPPEDALTPFSDPGPLERAVSLVLERTGDTARGGGRDNLGLVALRVGS